VLASPEASSSPIEQKYTVSLSGEHTLVIKILTNIRFCSAGILNLLTFNKYVEELL
jgi:hypothetical protein